MGCFVSRRDKIPWWPHKLIWKGLDGFHFWHNASILWSGKLRILFCAFLWFCGTFLLKWEIQTIFLPFEPIIFPHLVPFFASGYESIVWKSNYFHDVFWELFIMIGVWLIQNQKDQVESWKNCVGYFCIFLEGFTFVVASINWICWSQNSNPAFQLTNNSCLCNWYGLLLHDFKERWCITRFVELIDPTNSIVSQK